MTIDENFICGRCAGVLVPVGKQGEITVYQCSICKIGTQFECQVCHNPRSRLDKNNACMFCSGTDNFQNFKEQLKADLTTTALVQ